MNDIFLNLVVLRCSDTARAAEFYGRLGIAFKLERHGNGPEHYAADLNGIVFELYPAAGDGPLAPGTRIGFRVPSVDDAIAAVADRPESIVSPPKDSPWGRRAVVMDPDGHRVELVDR